MAKHLILFTMKGCPHCNEMKTKLEESSLNFVERDIEEYVEEYEMFVKITESEYVPSFMIIDDTEKSGTTFYTPEKDFQSLDEGLEIAKKQMI